MAEEKHTMQLDPQPQLEEELLGGKRLHIGLLGNYPDTEETRILLTPEACGLLTSAGMSVCMEEGAGIDIDFPDEVYAEYGVKICNRKTALEQDVVLSFAPLKPEDVLKMKEGATLLCMMADSLFNKGVIEAKLQNKITLCCLSNMLSFNGEPVFANIIDQIDGRGAIMYAQEHLSYLGGGKGVLLGGVAGVNPCEVVLVGDGREIYAAARAAIDQGAQVTLLNNDISALQTAQVLCGKRLTTLAIHPKVLFNKIKSADVIIMGNTTRQFEMPRNLTMAMKESVYYIDLRDTHPSVSVPRTVAMAVSNVMVNLLNDMALMEGIDRMIAATEGMQNGIITYKGQLVDKLAASYLGLPYVDLAVMIAHPN
ncbi:MAG: hypothetical protein J1F07_10220 [Muribaculaceae bacterium]|nr:hypothetical protein [Muribaculaceae bacterium]